MDIEFWFPEPRMGAPDINSDTLNDLDSAPSLS